MHTGIRAANVIGVGYRSNVWVIGEAGELPQVRQQAVELKFVRVPSEQSVM